MHSFLSFTFCPKPYLRISNSCLLQSAWRKSPLHWCFHGNRKVEGLQGQRGEHLKKRWEVNMFLLDISLQTLRPAWHWHDKLSPDVVVHLWGRTRNNTWSSAPTFDDEEEWYISRKRGKERFKEQGGEGFGAGKWKSQLFRSCFCLTLRKEREREKNCYKHCLYISLCTRYFLAVM